MVLDACRHHWPYERFSSRMCTCAVYPKTHCFVFLWFSTKYCWCIEHCFPMHSEDRNDRDQIEHMLALILAIDVWWSWPLISLNISPPPKKSLGTSDYKYFRVAFNTFGKKLDPEAQNVCIGCQTSDDTIRYSRCGRAHCLVLNLKTLVNATSMGVSNALHYPNEL